MPLQIRSYSLSQGCILYWVSQENKYHILMQSSSACATHITVSFPPILITDLSPRGLKLQLSEQEVIRVIAIFRNVAYALRIFSRNALS